MDVCNRHATFAHRSGATLDRTGAHVARGEHAGSARFHRARRAIHFLPGWGLRHCCAGEDEAFVVALDLGGEPASARQCAGHRKHRRCFHRAPRTGAHVLELD